MKYQFIKHTLLCVFTQFIFCKTFSQPATQTTIDSTQNAEIKSISKDVAEAKSIAKKTDSTVNGLEKNAVSKAKDSLENSDSASVFNAWKYAKAHPETLYPKDNKTNLLIAITVFLFLILFLYKAFFFFRNTALCKDESYVSEGVMRPDKERPYSYARVQMFWWTLIIICCYGTFFALYGKLIPLSPTCIILQHPMLVHDR